MTNKTYHYLTGTLAYGSILDPYVPKDKPGGKPSWSITILVDKEAAKQNDALVAYHKELNDTAKERFKGKQFLNWTWKDGDKADLATRWDPAEWMAGHIVVKAKNKFGVNNAAPPVIGLDNEPISPGSPDANRLIFAGQNVLVRLRIHAYTYEGTHGITGIHEGVKILGGGEPVSTDNSAAVQDGLAKHTPDDLPSYKEADTSQGSGGGDNEDIPW